MQCIRPYFIATLMVGPFVRSIHNCHSFVFVIPSYLSQTQTPILQCHGTVDEIVPFSRGKQTHKLLQTINSDVTFKEYPYMGHHSSEEEMEDLRAFLDKVIPPL